MLEDADESLLREIERDADGECGVIARQSVSMTVFVAGVIVVMRHRVVQSLAELSRIKIRRH